MGQEASLTVMDSENGGDELIPADISKMIDNPFYAIEFDPTLAARHKPIISEDQWIAANVELITELELEPLPAKPIDNSQGAHSPITRPLRRYSNRCT
jgi:hypothetical protein